MTSNHGETTHPELSILIIDDGPENLGVIGGLLKPFFRVQATTQGERGLAIARTAPHPDLILLDIMMPGMDGYEVLRQLRASSETAAIPVIFVTAMTEHGDEAKGLELGAVDYISKPVVPELLLARVKTQLELKNARDWLQDRNSVLAQEVARQVIELKKAKDIAEASSHAKSTFIRTMTHELNTPMNGVMGILQLMREEVRGDSPLLGYAETAIRSAKEMTRLLSSLLEYSDIAHGEVLLEKNLIDLGSFLTQMRTIWMEAATLKGLSVQLLGDLSVDVVINADERKLRRVLDILMDNAIAFTDSGHVAIEFTAEQHKVNIVVRDTGPGLSSTMQGRLFKPFEQGDGSSSREHGGIGLSLAIAYRLVELMGGELSFIGDADVGSSFHFDLPK